MAEEGPLLNAYPDPPPFYKHFTTENLERLHEIENEASNSAKTSKDVASTTSKLSTEQILALPTELRYLIPPPPPADNESFHVFGEPAKTSGTNNFTQMMEFVSKTLGEAYILSDWKYAQLYPTADPTLSTTNANIDRQAYLNRFNRSIIIEYISLLGVVALNPTAEHKDMKMKHILTLVCNMHALINEYRPHQAREKLIRIMEEQVARKKREIEGVRAMGEKVRGLLEGFGKAVEAEADNTKNQEADKEDAKSPGQDELRREAQRGMWDTVDEILGH